MGNRNIKGFIDVLYRTHKAEWEATPSNQQAIVWLSDLVEFLFPDNLLDRLSTYEGRLKKNQIDLENILLSYLDPGAIDIERSVAYFYDSLELIYNNLRSDGRKYMRMIRRQPAYTR